MVKVKTMPTEQRRSQRLALQKLGPAVEPKKKPAAKKGPKPKKVKLSENGNTKAEEPKAEATEAK